MEATTTETLDQTFVTLEVGNSFLWDHVARDLITIRSNETYGTEDYEWLIKEGKVTSTIRLMYCDACELIDDADFYRTESEFDRTIRLQAERCAASVRKQLADQGFPAPGCKWTNWKPATI